MAFPGEAEVIVVEVDEAPEVASAIVDSDEPEPHEAVTRVTASSMTKVRCLCVTLSLCCPAGETAR